MAVVAVAGVVNVETTVPVQELPVPYEPVRCLRHELASRPSGVGFNVAAALRGLGDEVRLAGYLGEDALGQLARVELTGRGLDGPGVLPCAATPQSVVLSAPDGRRSVFTDVKDLADQVYPTATFDELLEGADLAVASTIGFARGLLPMAQARGVPVAVDVQAIEGLDDPYLVDWLDTANVVFCSHERLPVAPREFAPAVLDRCATADLVVVGCGSDGCLLHVRGERPRQIAAVAPRRVRSTVGAGDALFAAFLHGRLRGVDPVSALEKAVLFAGWKIGAASGGEGFLTSTELDHLHARTSDDRREASTWQNGP